MRYRQLPIRSNWVTLRAETGLEASITVGPALAATRLATPQPHMLPTVGSNCYRKDGHDTARLGTANRLDLSQLQYVSDQRVTGPGSWWAPTRSDPLVPNLFSAVNCRASTAITYYTIKMGTKLVICRADRSNFGADSLCGRDILGRELRRSICTCGMM